MRHINIGADYSEDPAGRYYTDGPASGENFRENLLLKELSALGENEKLSIKIDGEVEAYGSSFLTEAFAGVVKYGYLRKSELLSKIEITYDDPEFAFYESRILKYVDEANYASKKYIPSDPKGATSCQMQTK